jgi:hypothetical protein
MKSRRWDCLGARTHQAWRWKRSLRSTTNRRIGFSPGVAAPLPLRMSRSAPQEHRGASSKSSTLRKIYCVGSTRVVVQELGPGSSHGNKDNLKSHCRSFETLGFKFKGRHQNARALTCSTFRQGWFGIRTWLKIGWLPACDLESRLALAMPAEGM